MIRRAILAVTLALLLAAIGLLSRFAAERSATAAPDSPAIYASPINAGCYIAAENECRFHVDPFIININTGVGAKLQQFTLYANNIPIYDFRTDVSNPPSGNFSPSPVMLDFAARCGETYFLSLAGKDTSDTNLLNLGQTAQFTCPAAVP